jgi:hypothetical protein
LRVKSTQRSLDCLANPDNPFFYAWTQQRNPKMTAKKQSRPARGRRTPRMYRAVKFQPFHCRHRWIENIAPICSAPVLFHFTIKTRNSPSLDVSLCKKETWPLAFERRGA